MSNRVRNRIDVDVHRLVSAYAAAKAASDDKSEMEIFYKIANSSIDFDGWREIFGWAPPASDLRALALIKMVELASMLSEWETVCAIAPAGSDQRRIAQEKTRQFYGE